MFHVLIQSTHINQQLDLFCGSNKERQAAVKQQVSNGALRQLYLHQRITGLLHLLKLASLSPVKNGGLEDDDLSPRANTSTSMIVEGRVGHD